MAATQDNSVQFSLAALQNMHDARVREEQEAAQKRAEAERTAKAEAARREALAIAEKAAAEAQAKALAEASRRAEEARLEAIRLAAVERARAEVEAAARLEMMEKADAHNRALAALREDQKKKRLKRALVSCVVAALSVVGGGAGLYFGKIKPDAEAKIANQSAAINELDEETARLRARLDQNGKKIDEAEARLAEAKRRASEASALVEKNEAEKNAPREKPVGATTKPPVGTKTQGGQCLPGEPGCDFNGNRIF